jgi:hypothetical protein
LLQQIPDTKIDFYLQFPDLLPPLLVTVELYIREALTSAPIAYNTIESHNVYSVNILLIASAVV